MEPHEVQQIVDALHAKSNLAELAQGYGGLKENVKTLNATMQEVKTTQVRIFERLDRVPMREDCNERHKALDKRIGDVEKTANENEVSLAEDKGGKGVLAWIITTLIATVALVKSFFHFGGSN